MRDDMNLMVYYGFFYIIQICRIYKCTQRREHSNKCYFILDFPTIQKMGRTSIFLLLLLSTSTFQIPTPLTAKHLMRRYGDALEAIFGIGVRLQALLFDPSLPNTSNFVVSPLSVSLLITQLMLGADEEFRGELYNLLSLPEGDDYKHAIIHHLGKRKNITYTIPYARLHSQMGTLMRDLEGSQLSKSFVLTCSNALFANSDLELKPEFLHNLQIYDTNVEALNFSSDPLGSQQAINDWSASKTKNLIKNILTSPLPTTASAVFVNAIYFSADWQTPFSYETNTKGIFRSTKDKSVEVTYMSGNLDNVLYAESDKLRCKMLGLPYKNNELSMYFLLPNENNEEEYDIRKFSENIKTSDAFDLLSEVKPRTVTVQIPKLKLSSSLSILKPMQKYRAYRKQFGDQDRSDGNRGKDVLDILDERVNLFGGFNTTERMDVSLNNAAQDRELKVTNLLQEVMLSVDEKGTEAAAVTASIIEYMGGVKNFRLNRPFVFFVRHEATSAVLFWGTIVDPSQNIQ